jgi:hypothetical protein
VSWFDGPEGAVNNGAWRMACAIRLTYYRISLNFFAVRLLKRNFQPYTAGRPLLQSVKTDRSSAWPLHPGTCRKPYVGSSATADF